MTPVERVDWAGIVARQVAIAQARRLPDTAERESLLRSLGVDPDPPAPDPPGDWRVDPVPDPIIEAAEAWADELERREADRG